MANVSKSVLVPQSRATLFDLVDRVEDYPQFLPWCGGATVLSRDEMHTKARIDIDFRGVRQSFTTLNRKEGLEWMRLELVEGPFRALSGHWRFTPLSESACRVELALEYSFANPMLEKLIGPVFDYIVDSLIDRFVARAEALEFKTRRQ
jgi:ribosome-associated toxin RatA of RatAB toxin-antitoxin module